MATKKPKPQKAVKKPATRAKKPAKAVKKRARGPRKLAAKKSATRRKSLPRKHASRGARPAARGVSTRPVFPTKIDDAAELKFTDRPEDFELRAAGQAGSLQGLSDIPEADSETVDELLEEGNAFEAGIVKGVEDAPDADEGEIRTHEVPENDVPEEYLDEEP